jgi:hypothetical protein
MYERVPQRPQPGALEQLRKPTRIHVISHKQRTKLMATVGNRYEFSHARELERRDEHEQIPRSPSDLRTGLANDPDAFFVRNRFFAAGTVDQYGHLRRR